MRSKFQERRMKKVPTTLGRRGYARTIADMVRTYIQYTYFNFCGILAGIYLFISSSATLSLDGSNLIIHLLLFIVKTHLFPNRK